MDELLVLLAGLGVAWYLLRARDQKARIALLGSYLGKYQIERQMETLIDGYLRWLGESVPERRDGIRAMLDGTEQSLATQFRAFAQDVQSMPAPLAQVSRLRFWIPFAQQLLPRWRLFDARQAFAIHAQGINRAADATNEFDAKVRARQMMAELMLMQHTCHWFCRSRGVADARLLLRHQSPHAQVLQTVSRETTQAYQALLP